jgi:hypothetical protein
VKTDSLSTLRGAVEITEPENHFEPLSNWYLVLQQVTYLYKWLSGAGDFSVLFQIGAI